VSRCVNDTKEKETELLTIQTVEGADSHAHERWRWANLNEVVEQALRLNV
jgi:hypothetical protein